MKVSTQKFLQSSGSRNLDLLNNIKLKAANLSQTKMKLMQKSKAISAQSIQLMSGNQEALNNARSFYQKGYIEGYQKAFMEGVKYASEEFQPQQSLLSSLISNMKKRGDGGNFCCG
jgi:flagellar biosynthesis/type III secretory pathway protein FliH